MAMHTLEYPASTIDSDVISYELDEQSHLSDGQKRELDTNPGQTLKAMVVELRDAYQGRRYGDRFVHGDTIVEDTIVPTRYEDGIGIEEIHRLTEVYASDLRAPQTTVSMVITKPQTNTASGETEQVTIQIDVDAAGKTTVEYYVNDEPKEIDSAMRREAVYEYAERAQKALDLCEDRSPDDRAEADESAKMYFEMQHPSLAAAPRETSLE